MIIPFQNMFSGTATVAIACFGDLSIFKAQVSNIFHNVAQYGLCEQLGLNPVFGYFQKLLLSV